MKKIILFVSGILFLNLYAQDIQMTFPHFAGKSYDFILFQGSMTRKIEGTIPPDGKFTLSVPKELQPYTGMSRWLITGTQEGGGLDMLIPGHDFSVSCTEKKPNNSNIIYQDNKEIAELTMLFKKQQEIFARHDAMLGATKAFPKQNKNYSVFEKEYQNQLKSYTDFQNELTQKAGYPADFLRMVNITQGIGTGILDSEEKKARNIAHYIANDLPWQHLYTSGHWEGIIASWVDLHSMVLKGSKRFSEDFSKVSKNVQDPREYTDLVRIVGNSLSRNGKDDFIKIIAPEIQTSGKVKSDEGVLSVFTFGIEGTQAADLEIPNKEKVTENVLLKSVHFAGKEYTKTLLVFYESGCGACEELLQDLPGKYEKLKSSEVRIISVSSDKDKAKFQNKAKDFPWKDVYCDYKGKSGNNFKSYGVVGTPTLILIDSKGKILKRASSLEEIIKKL